MNDDLDLDVGPISSAVFVGVQWSDAGPLAAFASDDGEGFVLDREALALRCEALERAGRDAGEEKKALRALRAGG